MSDLKKCDRCGVLVNADDKSVKDWVNVIVAANCGPTYGDYDFCPACADKFVDFTAEKRV